VYVLYTSYGGDLISGDIAQVISARKTGSVMIAKDRDYYPNGLCYLQSEYLVLSGYKEE
jgi:hypothetical protein